MLMMFSCFFMTYDKNGQKIFYKENIKNRRQNNLPLKPPACVHVNFLNKQMYLELLISLLMNTLF